MSAEEHICRPIIDPETGRVVASVRMSPHATSEDRAALLALVAAARAEFAAEHPEQVRPEPTEAEWRQLAADVVDHYTALIDDRAVRAYLREHRPGIPLIQARRIIRLIRTGQPITLGAKPTPEPSQED